MLGYTGTRWTNIYIYRTRAVPPFYIPKTSEITTMDAVALLFGSIIGSQSSVACRFNWSIWPGLGQ